MSRPRKAILAGTIVLVTLYAGASAYFAGIIVAFNTNSLEQDRQNLGIEGPAQFGLPEPVDVRVDTGGAVLAGWLFRNPARKRCAVIISHGHTGTRYGALKYAPIFFERGCAVLTLDARHHGESTGEYGTYGYYESQDLAEATGWLAQQLGITTQEIGLVGESMGASISMLAAARLPDGPAFVLADSCFRSLPAILSYQGEKQYGPVVLGLLPGALLIADLRADFDASEVSPEDAAAKLHVPVILIHSSSDEYTPPEHSAAIFERLPDERKALHITNWGATHGRSIDTNYGSYAALVSAFLDQYVPAFARPQALAR